MAKVASIQDNEQLYAVATILPFANLQELDLSGLQLNIDQWCALLEACSRCSGLRVLSIKGCDLGALGEWGETLDTAAAAAAAQYAMLAEPSSAEVIVVRWQGRLP